MNSPQHNPFWSPQNIFSWFAVLLPPTLYFYFVYSYSLNLPFADDFANLSQAISIFQSANFNEAFSIFFALENGHRIAFTRFIYILSHALFGEIDFRILILIGNIPLVVLLYLFFNVLNRFKVSLILISTGVAMSLDDFYLISSGLAATETTLFVYDQELFRNLTIEDSVYEPIRVMVSNRLAKNGSDWTNIFQQHNR